MNAMQEFYFKEKNVLFLQPNICRSCGSSPIQTQNKIILRKDKLYIV